MSGSSEAGVGTGERRVHPCIVPFVVWCAWVGCAVAAALISHSAPWLLLALPALPTLCLLASHIARGYPTTDVPARQRFIQILTEIGGEQPLTVIVQDQTASPCELRRGRHPTLIAALGLVKFSSDEVLRGLAALQYATLQSPRMKRRARLVRFITLFGIAAAAFLATAIAPKAAVLFAAFAGLPLVFWLTGALLAAWSRLDSAGAVFADLDRTAVESAGSATAVIDALLAMDAWREIAGDARTPVEAAAYRCAQPASASAHTASRVARLRARAEAA